MRQGSQLPHVPGRAQERHGVLVLSPLRCGPRQRVEQNGQPMPVVEPAPTFGHYKGP